MSDRARMRHASWRTPGSSSRGFTLVEMIVTLTILSILAAAALPLGETIQTHTRERGLQSALTTLRHAIDAYKEAVDTGRIAATTSSGYPPDLQSLVDGVEGRQTGGQRLYFLRRIPRDPFCPSGTVDIACWGVRAYATPREHPQAGEDVFDVYSLSDGIGQDGRSYREW